MSLERNKSASMAQLPPKIPNATLCWSDISDSSPPKIPSVASFSTDIAAAAAQDPFWADEFHDLSSARRQAHRRTVSDSIAFLEDPMLHVNNSRNVRPRIEAENEFHKFDDEKFINMFDNDVSGPSMPLSLTFSSSSKSSSPSDHNKVNDDKKITNQVQQQQHQNLHNQNEDQQHKHLKNESDEVENQITKHQEIHTLSTYSSDKIADPKRVKRILANRKSAQRSRVRKLQYISELERSVTSLQAEVSVLSPRVAFLDQQRLLLSVDNGDLKQRIAALAQDNIFKDAVQDALRREIERLRQVCHQKNLKNMESVAGSASPSPNPQCHG